MRATPRKVLPVTVVSGVPVWRRFAVQVLEAEIRPRIVQRVDGSDVRSVAEALSHLESDRLLIIDLGLGALPFEQDVLLERLPPGKVIIECSAIRTGESRVLPVGLKTVGHIDCPALSNERRQSAPGARRGTGRPSQLSELAECLGLSKSDAEWVAERSPSPEAFLAQLELWALVGSDEVSVRALLPFAQKADRFWESLVIEEDVDDVSFYRQVCRRLRQFIAISSVPGGLTVQQAAQRAGVDTGVYPRLRPVAALRSPVGWLSVLVEVTRLRMCGAPARTVVRRWLQTRV